MERSRSDAGSVIATGPPSAAPPAAWRRRIPRLPFGYQPARASTPDLGEQLKRVHGIGAGRGPAGREEQGYAARGARVGPTQWAQRARARRAPATQRPRRSREPIADSRKPCVPPDRRAPPSPRCSARRERVRWNPDAVGAVVVSAPSLLPPPEADSMQTHAPPRRRRIATRRMRSRG
jgi:hypothetical protein